MVKRMLPYLFFPMVMGAGLVTGYYITIAGSTGNIVAQGLPIVLVGLLVIALLERLLFILYCN